MLESPKNETTAMLESSSNPPGIELYCYANFFLLFSLKNIAVDHVSETQEYNWVRTTTKESMTRSEQLQY